MKQDENKEKCHGGFSYNCKRIEHVKAAEVKCYRCGIVMGCRWCCEVARELICLKCHNWATKKALKVHGDIIPNFKVPHVRTDTGWQHYEPTVGSTVDKFIIQADAAAKLSDVFQRKPQP